MVASAAVNEYGVLLGDLDGFLDELRHRGPNVEPVVRVKRHVEYQSYMTTWYLQATYLRAYGERSAVITLRWQLASHVRWPSMSLGASKEQMAARRAEDREYADRVRREVEAQYADGLARITAVAAEIGVGVSGGEVTH